MHYSVYAGLGFAALFGLVGPPVTRQVSPAIGAWLLTIGSVIAALSGVGAAAALAMTLVGQAPSVAAVGHWSIAALRHADPVELPVAIAALVMLTSGVGRLGWMSYRRGSAIAAAYRINRRVGDTGSDLVVLPYPAIDAYAVPGRPGRIFVTRGMLALLSRPECDAMLAHERAHLRHGHHWHRTVVGLASALNPLLLPLRRAQLWLTERWADEAAAQDNERTVVASALSRAAAAADPSWRRPEGALALTGQPVDDRIAALLDRPPRRRPILLAVAVALLALSVFGTLDGATDDVQLFHSTVSATAS
jgi:beta-lactamase regulating signal transducer with metallopeptidase domain